MKFEKFAIIPATATMFDENQRFDAKAQKKLIQMLLKKNPDGFYIGGSTGEGFSMTPDERKEMLSVSLETVAGKVPTIAYIGANDTVTAIELAKHAQKEGADAISSVRPYYGGFSSAQVLEYYKELSECVNIPIIAYNNANVQLANMSEIENICALDNCLGIKYTLHNHFEMTLIKKKLGDKLVFSGADEMFISAMITGVDGAIGSSYNCMIELFQAMRDSFYKNDIEMLTMQNEAAATIVDIFLRHSFMACMKTSLELLGVGKRYSRRPTISHSDEAAALFRKDMLTVKEQYQLPDIELFDLL